jgi:hypothetical protein
MRGLDGPLPRGAGSQSNTGVATTGRRNSAGGARTLRSRLGMTRHWALLAAMALAAITTAVGSASAASTGSPSQPVVDPIPPQPSTPAGTSPRSEASSVGWTRLASPPFTPDGMWLLTDGTVLFHEYATTHFWRLAPSSGGSYTSGTWSEAASLPGGDYAPLYFASAVLPDGRFIVSGGEYQLGSNGWELSWGNQTAIYDPVANTWAAVAPPAGWTNIGDAPSAVLPDGNFMLGSCCGSQQAILDLTTLDWTTTGAGKADSNNEEGWTLLPNGDLLTVDGADAPNTELYNPNTGTWSSAGATPVKLNAGDIGPDVYSPKGWVLAVGGDGNTALYKVKSGVWSAGPSFPEIGGQPYRTEDGPAAVLSDGNVLTEAGSSGSNPSHFWIFDGRALSQIEDPPNAPGTAPYYSRMLVLPTGQVLYTGSGNEAFVYTDNAGSPARWRPRITAVGKTLVAGTTNELSGAQIAGLTQGAAYGDDFQDITNYPLVRITDKATHDVVYCRTTGLTSSSIAPKVKAAVNFAVPSSIETGPSSLEVVANGIASKPRAVTITTER